MATNKNPLFIIVDHGFSDTKVIINGELFTFPREIYDITGKPTLLNKDESYLVSHYITDKSYYIGEIARKQEVSALKNNANVNFIRDLQQSEEYFSSMNCKISIMSVIGAALIKYKKIKKNLQLDDIDKSNNIFLGLALPHSYVNNLESTMIDTLSGTHAFSMETNEGEFNLKFTIKQGSIIVNSQAICAFVSVIADDNCVYDRTEGGVLKHLPALVIDGGYKTTGVFRFSEAEIIEQDKSYTEFSAYVIYNRVAERISKDYTTDSVITDLIVNDIIKNKKGLLKVLNNEGIYEVIDINNIFQEEKREVFRLFTKKLTEEYNLGSIGCLVLAGGTGAMFAEDFRIFLDEKFKNCAPLLAVAENEFMGKKTRPEFAIAIGLYKLLRAEYERAINAMTTEE